MKDSFKKSSSDMRQDYSRNIIKQLEIEDEDLISSLHPLIKFLLIPAIAFLTISAGVLLVISA